MSKLTLSDMIQELFGIRTNYEINPVVATIGVTAVNILRSNPNRVSFVVVNLSANAMYISPANTVSATNGVYVAPNGGSVSLIWDRDFELCSQAWYGIAGGAGSSVHILENYII